MIVTTVTTFNEIISIAIQREEEASKLYKLAAEKAPDMRSRQLLTELASEENEHRNFLAGVKHDKTNFPTFTSQKGSSISAVFLPLIFHEGMSFTEIIVYAIQKEDQSCLLYRELAGSDIPPELVKLMNYLADIEQIHKRKLEEYFSVEVDTLL